MIYPKNSSQFRKGLRCFDNLEQIKNVVFCELYKSPLNKNQMFSKINASKYFIKKAIRELISEKRVFYADVEVDDEIWSFDHKIFYTSNPKQKRR